MDTPKPNDHQEIHEAIKRAVEMVKAIPISGFHGASGIETHSFADGIFFIGCDFAFTPGGEAGRVFTLKAHVAEDTREILFVASGEGVPSKMIDRGAAVEFTDSRMRKVFKDFVGWAQK